MKKLLIGTALLVTALPFTFDGVTPTVSKARAEIGRPLTPGSVAGVHRRAMHGAQPATVPSLLRCQRVPSLADHRKMVGHGVF
jgi:hypothetical protein